MPRQWLSLAGKWQRFGWEPRDIDFVDEYPILTRMPSDNIVIIYASILRLPTTSADIHPSLNLGLKRVHTTIHELHQWILSMFSDIDIPTIQNELIDVQLDRPVLNTALHNLGRKVVCAVERHHHSAIYLTVDPGQSVKVELGPSWTIVAVDVSYARCKKVNLSSEKVLDLLRRSKECWHQISHQFQASSFNCNLDIALPSRDPVSAIPSSPPLMRPLSASTAMPRS